MKEKEKYCYACETSRAISFFSKDKNRSDGLKYECKICAKNIADAYKRTKRGLISKILQSQRSNVKKRNHKPPNYTLDELYDWVTLQPTFNKLYDNWVKSDYKKELIPSIDRKDDKLSYTFDNIQLMTWKENHDKAGEDIRKGKLVSDKAHKAVIQLTKNGVYIDEFVSASEAARVTGANQASISSCCLGTYKTSGGYCWEFK